MNGTRHAMILLGVVLAILTPLPFLQAESDPDAGPPRIRFDKATHDFGTVSSDQKVSYRWVFHNDGGQPLEILEMRPSCGCTATVLESETIPPGGTGILELTFDPAGQHGSVRKSLAVTSNDPANSVARLTVRANVVPANVPEAREGHPPFTGQSLLMGQCASCHAEPAAGKTGGDLYEAVCAMCHGPRAEGNLAPSLRAKDYLASRDDEELSMAIAYGTANPRMPGFSRDMGGPLDQAQIRSLVKLVRQWGPLTARPEVEGSEAAAPSGQ